MEMTYDGALVMPMGCAMMDEDEMIYVEGGQKVTITLSRDFLRDCVTSSASAIGAIVCGLIGLAVSGPGSVIGAAVGAAIGWTVGGTISRSKITKDVSFKVNIPIKMKKNSYYIA